MSPVANSLHNYLRQLRRFDESTARFYPAEIVLAFEYLHEKQGGVFYRDLKPENLLLDEDGHKLVDFGFAKRLHEQDRTAKTYTLCGTSEYLAPEVLYNEGYTTTVDWWSLGVLIYEFLVGYSPFLNRDASEIYKQIINKPITFSTGRYVSEATRP
ncbi:kinase-like domain-containing protein [Diaporthe sp. PMI_573]|nr:kinase-like domain-containing protein [Diaporthaceae sp. PMI_573]